MKLFLLACIVVCVQANSWGQGPVAVVSKAVSQLSTGTSTSSRTQDSAGNYRFSYNEQHGDGGSSRDESGNGWGAQGSYTLNVADGRQRVVKYVADGAGFRAAISTNEPGTAALPAASTSISSPFLPPQPVAPLPVPVAVAPVAHPAPEPVAVAVPAPITNGWGPAPVAIAPVVKAVPAVSSYSTSINHVAPAPVAVAPISGWGNMPAVPAPIALPAPIQLKGWN